MKLLYLLLSLVLVVLIQISFAAYEVKFISQTTEQVNLYIDNNKKAKLWGCRYNSTGRVYCEVTIPYTITKNEQQCGLETWTEHGETRGPAYRCHDHYVTYNLSSHYRIHMKLNVREFGSTCEKAFKHSATFSNVYLSSNGKGQSHIAKVQVNKGTLPSNFGTINNKKYTFKFVKDKCTFYGDFTTIDAYKA